MSLLLLCGGFRVSHAGINALSINITCVTNSLFIGWRGREWHWVVFYSFNSVILHLLPVVSCMFSDNQLVFAPSQSYVRRVNICWKHLSDLDRTGGWRDFSQSGCGWRVGEGGWLVGVYGVAVNGLFLPVLSDISHGLMLTGWQCVGGMHYWTSILQYSTIKYNPTRFVVTYTFSWTHLQDLNHHTHILMDIYKHTNMLAISQYHTCKDIDMHAEA